MLTQEALCGLTGAHATKLSVSVTTWFRDLKKRKSTKD